MGRINKILFLLLFLASLQGKSEQTAGHCGLSEEEKGPSVLSLLPGTTFYASAPGQLKVRIWLEAKVHKNDLYFGIRFNAGAKIYNKAGKQIGQVKAPFNPMQQEDENDTLVAVIISGYLEKGCIDARFIPEEELSGLLLKANNNENIKTFLPWLEKYQLQKMEETGKYTSFLLYQPEFTKQQLEPRLLIIFYQDELIAIFHTRPIKVKQYDSIEMGKEYKMIYNSKFSEHTKSEMVELFRNQFKQ